MSRRARLLLLVPAGLVVACALALGLLLGAPRPWALAVGGAEAAPFLYGFEPPEDSPEGAFRWSGPDARVLAHGAGSGPAVIALRLNGDWLNAQGAPGLALSRAGRPVAAFDLAPGWRVYRAILPPGAVAAPDGQGLPLELASATATPGVRPEGRDRRALGVPTAALRIAPLAGAGAADVVARGLRMGWLLGAVVGLALALDLALLARRREGAWLRAAALALLLGAALLLAARADPVGLAYALPPTPWALGLLSAAAGGLAVAALAERAPRPRPSVALAWGGLGLLAAGGLLLHLQTAVAAGLGLVVLGLYGLLAAGLGAGGWGGLGAGRPDLAPRSAGLLLGLVLAVALAMRLWGLGDLPFGLWRDEARHGLFALRILEDPAYRPVYIASERVNMPALGLYPFAAALGVFGPQLWTMRLVTAVAGALTVLPLYGLAHRLAGRRDVALLAAALLAVSSWHVAISRFSFPTVFDPLFGLTGLWLILAAAGGAAPGGAPGRLAAMAGAGACLGLAVQTYHTGRVVPAIAAALLALLVWREPAARRPALLGGLALGAGFALVIGPYVAYALAQPAAFNDRVSAVFVLGDEARKGRAPLGVIDQALRDHLLMFNAFGDANARHHAPGRPLLDYLSGLGFLAGCAVALRAWRDWRSHFLLVAVGLSLAPSALAVDAPHAMRGFGAAAFACLLAAAGWAALWGLPLGQPRAARRPAAGAALVAACLALNAWLYFVWMPPRPEVFTSFYPVQSRIGAYLRGVADREGAAAAGAVYLPAGLRGDPVIDYLAHGLAFQTFEGAALSAPPPPGARFVLTGYFAEQERAGLAAVIGPAAPELVGEPFPDGRGPTYYVYRAP